ncbi:MAG: cell division ATP-binding protein FtsE [Candidatus Coatesbacteria bacterium]|nr:MAG: cell division ATP-binding protein FtsE [Candidatus Coatesbacteria bacterium]
MSDIVRFENVTKIYERGIVALRDASFAVSKGEMVFLTGPSGAGKTTIMRLIFAEIKPDYGRIFVAGEDITNIKRHQIPYLRRHIGVVFQDFRLLNDRTVAENLDIVLIILGFNARERKKRLLDILSRVGLAHRTNSYPRQLSGGEQQRVAIARALATDPMILLADEPTGNLDPDTSWDIMQNLRQINARGTTMIIATHNYEIVRKIEARVMHIVDGVLVGEKEFSESLKSALFEKR